MPERDRQSIKGLTLIEVIFSLLLLAMCTLGVLQAMLQSRRMTEGSIRQATVASLVQGYLEQIKSIKYSADGTGTNALPSSPSTTPADTAAWATNSVSVKDSGQFDKIIYLAVSPAPTGFPDVTTLPTDASLFTESVDIDGTAAKSELKLWVWVETLSGTNVVNCKAITIVYEWTTWDGKRTRKFSDVMRTIRSVVPTD